MKLYSTKQVADRAGVSDSRIRRWANSGFLVASGSRTYRSEHYFSVYELNVAVLMARLFDAGFSDFESVHHIARKHFEDVDKLRVMGHTGDSIATEHTIGDGMVLTIT